MTRFGIDAPTLLHLVAERVPVAPGHQLVAPQLLRSQALALLFDAVRRGELTEGAGVDRHDELTRVKVRLLGDLFVSVDPDARARADGVVPVGSVDQLSG